MICNISFTKPLKKWGGDLIPKVAKSGHSFKGAAAYYLHDKTQDNDFNQASGAKAQTSDRVEWTETRNLATDNPDLAWKIMAASALDGDRLKQINREAEGKRAQASGEQNGKSVYAYSLGWHPDEKDTLTREDMTAAANASLEKLGFKDHQAMIVAHNDTAHPHVHVLVNKVNQQTGKMHNPNMDYKTLDKWAREYRQERGQEHYCQNREDKWKKNDQGVSNENREKQTNTRLNGDENKTMNADDPRAAEFRKNQAARNNRVSEIGKNMKTRHDEQWTRFKANNKQAKEDIYDRYKRPMQDARERLNTAKKAHADIKEALAAKMDNRIDAIKAKYKPAMSQIGKQQWKDKKNWNAHERSLSGRVGHAITAALINRKLAPSQSKGFVKDAFKMLVNTGARNAAFEKVQKAQFDKVAKDMRKEMNAARKDIAAERKEATAHTIEAMGAAVADMKNLNNHRTGELAGLKASIATNFTNLKTNQQHDRQRLKAIWGKLKAGRTKALRGLKNRMENKARVQNATAQSFKAAAKEEATKEAKKKTRTRNRSKDRKRSRGRTQRYEP